MSYPTRKEVVVFGSQAAHAWMVNLPDEVDRSREIDIAPFDDADHEKAFKVNWVMGELSAFDTEHTVYAEGVGLDLFSGPTGWLQRAKVLSVPRSDGSALRVLCPELHDLCVSKLIAGREKDEKFVTSLAREGAVQLDWIEHLLTGTEAEPHEARRAIEQLNRARRSLATDS